MNCRSISSVILTAVCILASCVPYEGVEVIVTAAECELPADCAQAIGEAPPCQSWACYGVGVCVLVHEAGGTPCGEGLECDDGCCKPVPEPPPVCEPAPPEPEPQCIEFAPYADSGKPCTTDADCGESHNPCSSAACDPTGVCTAYYGGDGQLGVCPGLRLCVDNMCCNPPVADER